jgi:hypothetical protein
MAYTARAYDVWSPTANPIIEDIARWGYEVETAAAMGAVGIKYWSTNLAGLPNSGVTEGEAGAVLNDGTPANDGIYVRVGSSWIKRGPLPGIPGSQGEAGPPGEDADVSAITAAYTAAIAVETAARIADVDAETAARSTQASNLEDAIDLETTNRIAAVAGVTAALGDEVTARTAADSDLQTQITTEVSTRSTQASNLEDAIDLETTNRLAGDAATSPLQRWRPGARPEAFCGNALGGEAAPAASGTSEISDLPDLGEVRVLQGAGFIIDRNKFPVGNGERWWLRSTLQRKTNPSDPAGDAVWLRINWLDASGGFISATVAWPTPSSTPLTEAMGKQELQFRFGAAGLQPPAGATDATVGIQSFGPNTVAGGETHVAIIAVGPSDPFLTALETLSIDTLTSDPVIAELGASVAPELEWTISGPGTVVAQRINGSASGLTAASRSSTRASISADTTYELEVDSSNGETYTRDIAVDFQHRAFWGGAAAAPANSAAVLALGNSELTATRARTKTLVLADQYPVIAYPVSFGAHVQITGNGFGLSGEVVSTVSVTTAAGFTGDYYVVRWPEKVTGTLTIGIS